MQEGGYIESLEKKRKDEEGDDKGVVGTLGTPWYPGQTHGMQMVQPWIIMIVSMVAPFDDLARNATQASRG